MERGLGVKVPAQVVDVGSVSDFPAQDMFNLDQDACMVAAGSGVEVASDVVVVGASGGLPGFPGFLSYGTQPLQYPSRPRKRSRC